MIPNKLVQSHYGPMIINANDKYIGRSIEQLGAWAAEDIELIKSILSIQLQDREYLSFYDVGSNIGTHTVALAKHFSKKIRVRSFEAQRQIFYMLCGNVSINGLDNVICENYAVSDCDGSIIPILLPDYSVENNFGGFELVEPCHSDNQDMAKKDHEQVLTTTIDRYQEPVDFLKLDIEGMEHLALTGATKTFEQHRPICFFEVLKTDVQTIKTFFADRDYQLHEFRAHDWIAVPKESDVELDLPVMLI